MAPQEQSTSPVTVDAATPGDAITGDVSTSSKPSPTVDAMHAGEATDESARLEAPTPSGESPAATPIPEDGLSTDPAETSAPPNRRDTPVTPLLRSMSEPRADENACSLPNILEEEEDGTGEAPAAVGTEEVAAPLVEVIEPDQETQSDPIPATEAPSSGTEPPQVEHPPASEDSPPQDAATATVPSMSTNLLSEAVSADTETPHAEKAGPDESSVEGTTKQTDSQDSANPNDCDGGLTDEPTTSSDETLKDAEAAASVETATEEGSTATVSLFESAPASTTLIKTKIAVEGPEVKTTMDKDEQDKHARTLGAILLERLGLPKTVRVGRAKTELRKMASAVKNSDWQRQLETALDGTQDESVEASADLVNRLGRAMVTASISLAEPSMGASAQLLQPVYLKGGEAPAWFFPRSGRTLVMPSSALPTELARLLELQDDAACQHDIETLRREVRELKTEIDRLKRELAAAEKEVHDRGAPRRALEAEIEETQARLSPIVTEKSQLKTRIIDIQHDDGGARTVEAALDRLQVVEEAWVAARRRVTETSEGRSFAKVQHEIEMATRHCELTEKEKLLESLLSKHLQLEKECAVLRLTVKKLESNVEPMRAARTERDRLRTLCETLWTTINELQQETAASREALWERRGQAAQLATSEAEVESGRASIQQLTSRRANLKAEVRRYSESIAEHDRRIATLRRELANKKAEREQRSTRLVKATGVLSSASPSPTDPLWPS